jgi:hypothetical protein
MTNTELPHHKFTRNLQNLFIHQTQDEISFFNEMKEEQNAIKKIRKSKLIECINKALECVVEKKIENVKNLRQECMIKTKNLIKRIEKYSDSPFLFKYLCKDLILTTRNNQVKSMKLE